MGAKHHYVPKFLLRQFSADQKRIDVFQIKPRRLYANVGLSDQCYERFYYGKDNDIEDAFAKLESEASQTIRTICEAKLDKVTVDQLYLLRQFIIYQGSRTKAAADESNRFMSATTKELFRKHVEIEGMNEDLPADLLDMIDIKFSDSQYLSLSGAAHSMPAVYDLDMKILVSKGSEEFILSDSPVIRCNQFAEFHPHFSKLTMGTRGLAQKGIQLFMPVSPNICLALYDPTTYQYGSPKRPFILIGNGDLKLLNRIQALGADTCLYQSISGPGYDQLCKYSDFREMMIHSKKPTVQRSQERLSSDGKLSQLFVTSSEKFLTGRKFSFATVTDKSDYSRHVTVPIRSKELGENIKTHRDELDRREAEMKKGTD